MLCSALSFTPFQAAAQAPCNLIQNGDFESYNAPIATYNYDEDNIISSDASAMDGTPNWRAVNSNGGDLYNTDFTTNRINPARGPYDPFTPHGGKGAIQIQSVEVGGNYPSAYSEYSQQAVTLIAGNYYAEYWILKSALSQYPTLNSGFMPIRMQVRPDNVGGASPSFGAPNAVTTASTNIVSTPAKVSTTVWNRVSGILNLANGPQYVILGCTDFGNSSLVTVHFIDDVALYKIPTAGPPAVGCNGAAVTIGEGCAIPNATYAWTTGGGAPFATTLQTAVAPTATTTYILTVTLPDGSTSASTVTVSVYGSAGPPVPQFVEIDQIQCQHQARFQITNFNPELTYTVTNVSNAIALPLNPITSEFRVKGATAGTNPGIFTVTATACGRSTTSGQRTVVYQCNQGVLAAKTSATTAYPNPVTESLTLPAGAEGPTLFNAQGQPVLLLPDAAGKLDVKSLPNGLYNLRMRQDGKLVNQRIEVKH